MLLSVVLRFWFYRMRVLVLVMIVPCRCHRRVYVRVVIILITSAFRIAMLMAICIRGGYSMYLPVFW